jgi:hypothetical protein
MVGVLRKRDAIFELSDFGIELLDFLLEECVLIGVLICHPWHRQPVRDTLA